MDELREESFIEKIFEKIEEMKYQSVLVECALFKKDGNEEKWHIYVLKIILERAEQKNGTQRFINKENFAILKTSWSLSQLREFLLAIAKIRKIFNETQKYPEQEDKFDIAGYPTRVCGNYPRDEIELIGSDRARTYHPLRMDGPYYYVDYALYRADGGILYTIQSTLENEDPPFSNPAEAVNHYLNLRLDTSSSDFRSALGGIVLPIYGAKIKRYAVKGKNLKIEVERDNVVIGDERLTLSVIFRDEDKKTFSKKIVAEKAVSLSAPFAPLAVDINLFKGDLKLDYCSWRRSSQSLFTAVPSLVGRPKPHIVKQKKIKKETLREKRNPLIFTAPVVLFCGAGASRRFGMPLMGDLIQRILNEQDLRNKTGVRDLLSVLAQYRSYDLERVLEDLDELSTKPYLCDVRASNYVTAFLSGAYFGKEELSPQLQALEMLSRESKSQPLLGPVLQPPLGTEKDGKTFASWFGVLVQQCLELRQIVEEKTIDYYGRSTIDSSTLPEVYTPLFKTLTSRLKNLGKPVVLPIFTTNYDRCLEEYALSSPQTMNLLDGFDKRNPSRLIWKSDIFSNWEPDPLLWNLVLFKLHGSVFWYEVNGEILYSPVALHSGKSAELKNALIYPAQKKIALNDPFLTAYDYLQRCLDHAELCIVIGYSFRDYETIATFKQSLSYNNNLRIIVVDPQAQQLISNQFSGLESRFTSIENQFGWSTDYLENIRIAFRGLS